MRIGTKVSFLCILIAIGVCNSASGLICEEKELGVIKCDDGEIYEHKEGPPTGTTLAVYISISVFLVLFAGLMSGLTLGLMTLDLIDLQILQRGGEGKKRNYASKIIPLIKRHHLTLVTLLLANAAAMEALPIFLDKLTTPLIAIILSVTAVLLFGEIIPQALCARYGIAIGARMAWLVKLLMILTFPVTWPISKVLDWFLGHENRLYRRKELKELVTIHGDSSVGGELTMDECTIIKGALDLKEKTVGNVMIHMENVFMLELNDKLDKATMTKISETGISRIPIYKDSRESIIGMLLVKNLILNDPEHNVISVSQAKLRPLPTVPASMPLYDILNEFQTGKSHMALVRNSDSQEIIGIVTMEDIIEELIQEDIVDETDIYIDVEHRTKVARLVRADESVRIAVNDLRSPRVLGHPRSTSVPPTGLERNYHLLESHHLGLQEHPKSPRVVTGRSPNSSSKADSPLLKRVQ
jgi:CBS domain containing-hemolysin-like protein